MKRQDLEAYLNTYLACDSVSDYAPNGLQIEGRTEIKRLCTAVSICQSVIEEAAAWKADAILVHHGFFWKGEASVITGIRRQRIAGLLINNINLFAYHLPLDIHPIVGNNACLAKLLQVDKVSQHDLDKIPNGMLTGMLPKSATPTELSQYLNDIFKQTPIHISADKPRIQSLAWCSGGAQDFIVEAKNLGADAYVSGEVSERTFDLAKELEIHYFACGHHATERYGVQALGSHLETLFGVEHRFIDTNNPI